MRNSVKWMLAGAGIVVASALIGLPLASAMAGVPAVTRDVTPPPQSPLRTWGNIALPDAPGTEQRMAERVQRMSQELLRITGQRYPGEDFLGSGTSITH